LREEQLRTQLRSQEDSVANEVRSAVRGVSATYKQLEVADRGRSFAEERLRSFIRRNEVGLATTRDVLDVENELAAAKNRQIAARAAYDAALTQYRRVTGRLLEDEKITLNEQKIDLPAY
ncbi:MAG TPA: TolC family protein, partial [Verrucomicrobiae bacterium]|nr:TolC family protein [Verrucomicrobiae bacterium]